MLSVVEYVQVPLFIHPTNFVCDRPFTYMSIIKIASDTIFNRKLRITLHGPACLPRNPSIANQKTRLLELRGNNFATAAGPLDTAGETIALPVSPSCFIFLFHLPWAPPVKFTVSKTTNNFHLTITTLDMPKPA